MYSFLRPLTALFVLFLAMGAGAGYASPPPPGLLHIRGTVVRLSGSSLVVQTSTGALTVALPPKTIVAGIVPSSRANVKPGSFLGIASTPDATGAQVAREVVVFPEAARGTGEGSYDWDLPGQPGTRSRMTNGTVGGSKMSNGTVKKSKMTNGTVNAASNGSVTLQYKNGSSTGSQSITLPAGIPYVTFVPGSTALLTPGVHVFVIGKKLPTGSIVAARVLAGKNGLTPPM